MSAQFNTNPNATPDNTWDRVKEAFKRDWEQTKNDFSSKGGEKLNQGVGDTVKQATGSAPIPPAGIKTHPTPAKEAIQDAEKARQNMAKESKKAVEEIAKAKADVIVEKAKLEAKAIEVQNEVAAEKAKAQAKIADAHEKANNEVMKANEKRAKEVAEAQKGLVKKDIEAGEKLADAAKNADEEIAKKHQKIGEVGMKRDESIMQWQIAEQEARYGYMARGQYPAAAWDDRLETMLRAGWDKQATGRSWEASRDGIRRGWDFANKSAA